MALSLRAVWARRGLALATVAIGCATAPQTAAAQGPDTTPPETTITEGPADGSVIDTDAPIFQWQSSEGDSKFNCVVDGMELPCERAFADGASPGQHSFSVAAVDPAGNIDPTPATRTFTVDLADTLPEFGSCPLDGNIVVGTIGDDTRTGTPQTDIMFGLGGSDVLRGAARPDCLTGQSGADQLFGGPGGDYLFGGLGNDRLAGAAGNDQLHGESGSDRITGGSGIDVLEGGGGGDRLSDSSGRDNFLGGPGNDTIDARDANRFGRSLPDSVRCGPGRDTVLVDRRDRVARDCERVRRRAR